MKTLTGLLIVLSVTLISCTNTQQENNALLTSVVWAVEQAPLSNGEKPKITENHTFQNDGKYLFEFDNVKVTGLWKWTDKNEIFLQLKSIDMPDRQNSFDKSLNYYIRILEITEDKLRTLERFETDAWDSGFAKERTYKRI